MSLKPILVRRRGVVGEDGGMGACRVVVFATKEAHARAMGAPRRRQEQRLNNAREALVRQRHRAIDRSLDVCRQGANRAVLELARRGKPVVVAVDFANGRDDARATAALEARRVPIEDAPIVSAHDPLEGIVDGLRVEGGRSLIVRA